MRKRGGEYDGEKNKTACKPAKLLHSLTYRVLAKVLSDLEDQADLVALHLEGVEDRGQRTLLKRNVDDGTDDRHNLALNLDVRGESGCTKAADKGRKGEGGGQEQRSTYDSHGRLLQQVPFASRAIAPQ